MYNYIASAKMDAKSRDGRQSVCVYVGTVSCGRDVFLVTCT